MQTHPISLGRKMRVPVSDTQSFCLAEKFGTVRTRVILLVLPASANKTAFIVKPGAKIPDGKISAFVAIDLYAWHWLSQVALSHPSIERPHAHG
tara:strand:- start:2229 stop:2510 length:282 start_codon:yes stop_codon:yes gene_type:complete